jgi:hypothetical protein
MTPQTWGHLKNHPKKELPLRTLSMRTTPGTFLPGAILFRTLRATLLLCLAAIGINHRTHKQ